MAILVGWMDSSYSIGIFSVIIYCINSSRVDVEEWEYLLWTYYTLSERRVHSVIGVRKGAHHCSISLRCVDVLPELDGEEGINYAIVV